jgi:hypothetical protein
MNRLIARVDAPGEVRAFPLRLRQELRRLHEKYYRLTFHKADIFGEAVPGMDPAFHRGLASGYGVVLSPRFNHIGICWNTLKDVVNETDLMLISQYIVELFAILHRYGYSLMATNPLRKIHIDTSEDANNFVSIVSITIDFGVPEQFFWYEI